MPVYDNTCYIISNHTHIIFHLATSDSNKLSRACASDLDIHKLN